MEKDKQEDDLVSECYAPNTENNYRIRMLLIMLNILDHFPYLEKLKYFLGGELCGPHVLNL